MKTFLQKLVVKQFAMLLLAMLGAATLGWAQPWTYNFGTTTKVESNAGNSTAWFPGTPTNVISGGTYKYLLGVSSASVAGGGSFNLMASTLGTGSMLGIQATTYPDGNSATNKFSVYSWADADSVAYAKWKLKTTSTGDGALAFSLGNANNASGVNNSYSKDYNTSLVNFAINYGGGNISSVIRRINGSNVTINDHGFEKDSMQVVEVYGNNAGTTRSYVKGSTKYTLASQTWDLWVDGVRVVAGAATAGTLAKGSLAGFAFYAENSADNAAWMYIDDLEYGLAPSGQVALPFEYKKGMGYSNDVTSKNLVPGIYGKMTTGANGGDSSIYLNTAGYYFIVHYADAAEKMSYWLNQLAGTTDIYESSDGANFTSIKTITTGAANYDTVSLNAASRFVKFVRTAKTNAQYIGNIAITPLPCATPTNLAVTPSDVSATATWNAPDRVPNLGYQMAYTKSSETEPTYVAATGVEKVITDLSTTSTYALKMRSVCAVGDTSSWTADVPFTTTGAVASITPAPTALNFGNVQLGAPKQLSVSVTASSLSGNITLSTPGNGFVAVAAGGWDNLTGGTIDVTYTPTAEGGVSDSLILTSGTARAKVTLTGTGVKPSVTTSVKSINFGTIKTGADSTISFTLTPHFLKSNLTLTASTGFQVDSASIAQSTGVARTIKVKFVPTAPQIYNGTLTISGGGLQADSIITLTGTATPAVAPALHLSTTLVDFGNQEVSTTSAAHNVRVTGSNLYGNITYSLSDVTNFAVSATTFAADTGGTLAITFTPQVASQNYTAKLYLSSGSDLTLVRDSVTIVGASVAAGAPYITLNVANLAFGNQVVTTTSAAQSVTVSGGHLTGNITYTLSDNANYSVNTSAFVPATGGTLGITFTPQSTGVKSAKLYISDVGATAIDSVLLSGAGVVTTLATDSAQVRVGKVGVGGSKQATVKVNATYLTANVKVEVTGANAAMFSVDSSTLAKPTQTNKAIHVTYHPTATGNHSALLVLSSALVDSVKIPLSGACLQTSMWVDSAQVRMGLIGVGKTKTVDIHVSAVYLSDSVRLSLSGTNAAKFSLNAHAVISTPGADSLKNKTVKITYTPTGVTANDVATLTLSTPGTSIITIPVSAGCAASANAVKYTLAGPGVNSTGDNTNGLTGTGSNYLDHVNITLTCATPGAAIYYTTDGSTPTKASTLYTGAIRVSSTPAVAYKAMAFAAGYSSDSTLTLPRPVIVPIIPATLPFTFDGGKADIATNAATPATPAVGIASTSAPSGNDAAASPKMNFNATGNNAIIHFSDAPTWLSYVINKADVTNEFNVLESVDGIAFTAIKKYGCTTCSAYPTMPAGAPVDSVLLQSSTRFVKFEYARKVRNQVNLGNIKVAKCGSCYAPTSLSATGITSSSANLSWSGTGSHYQLAYAVAGATDSTKVEITTGAHYALSGLSSEQTYYFKVRGIYGSEYSPWSTVSSFTTLSENAELLDVNTSSINAGSIQVGVTSPAHQVVVTGANLTSAITISTPGHGFVVEKATGWNTLTGGTLNITFTPTAEGVVSDSVVLESGVQRAVIQLSGEGEPIPTNCVVTITAPNRGLLLVKHNGAEVASGATLPIGTVLTVQALAATGYELSSLKVNDGYDVHDVENGGSYTLSTGTATFSAVFQKPTAVNTLLASKIKLYPNPATDFLYTQSDEVEVAFAEVFSVQGNLVLWQYVSAGMLDLHTLPAGSYYVRLHTSQGVVVRQVSKK